MLSCYHIYEFSYFVVSVLSNYVQSGYLNTLTCLIGVRNFTANVSMGKSGVFVLHFSMVDNNIYKIRLLKRNEFE